MTKTVNSNYGSIGAPGNTFDRRISADSDTFARNDVDALGMALDDHTHASGLGLAVPYAAIGAVAWTSWTPALTQGATNPTSTNILSTYVQVGKIVIVQFNIAPTSAGSAGNAIIVSVPITPRRQAQYNSAGTFIYVTVGGTIYAGVVVIVSNGTAQLVITTQTGYLGVAPSVAIANGDNFSGQLCYEAA